MHLTRPDDLHEGLIFHVSANLQRIIFVLSGLFCLSPMASPPIALTLGMAIAQFTGHPFINLNHRATNLLLKISVVGLGFGMNMHTALQAGKGGFLFTLASIGATLVFGYFLGKWFETDKKASFLISAGTAICGGSAIAAIAPVIKAEERQTSVALGCVFLLNSIALVVFPIIGHHFNLSQTQFGLWCAIAIHDTSSVIGASSKYGAHALEVATTVKLVRVFVDYPAGFCCWFYIQEQVQKDQHTVFHRTVHFGDGRQHLPARSKGH